MYDSDNAWSSSEFSDYTADDPDRLNDLDEFGGDLLDLRERREFLGALERVRECDERFPPSAMTTDVFTPADAGGDSSEEDGWTEAGIRRELFRRNRSTGRSCLQALDAEAPDFRLHGRELIVRLIHRFYKPRRLRTTTEIFSAQPGTNGSTILHSCVLWGLSPKAVWLVVKIHPEAMCTHDGNQKIPLHHAKRKKLQNGKVVRFLKKRLKRYLPQRVRVCVRLCTDRLFLGSPPRNGEEEQETGGTARTPPPLTPFDEDDRRTVGVDPRPWFVASVLGYALQREMKGLAPRVLSFVGCDAELEPASDSIR